MNERRSLMVVHAHPDDEVFSTGGILAKYAAAGDRVSVVYCTNGDAGEMFDPDLQIEEAMPRLGEIRQDEARAACALLGVTDVFFLDYRDSGMKDTEENSNPAAFMNAPLDEAVDKLLDAMHAVSPQVLVTYDAEGGYGHPDHVMTHRISVAAFERAQRESWGPRKLYYSARSREGFRRYHDVLKEMGMQIPWLREDFNFDEYGVPDTDITAHIDISDVAVLKKPALAIHKTQIKPDFFYLSIPDEAFRSMQNLEYFVRIQPPHSPGEHERDLFDGLPVGEDATAAVFADS